MPYLKPESLKDTFDVSFRVRDGGSCWLRACPWARW